MDSPRGNGFSKVRSLVRVLVIGLCLECSRAGAEVRVYVEEQGGRAWIRYECTAGELVRAFPLDVSVDEGRIVGISDFFQGPCTESAQGYGIFPAAFRDHIAPSAATNVDWTAAGYTPLAIVADDPEGTLPGLGSSGVTLEFGALWNSSEPATRPPAEGTLCVVEISRGAAVSVSANESRGGVLAADADMILAPVFTGAFVQPPEVTGVSVSNGQLTLTFAGGELETAPCADGPWSTTGNTSGEFVSPVDDATNAFYRVRRP